MNGLQLSREFYNEFGKPMLEENFSDLLPYLAVGFVGKGSEHYGFDDEISADHDFEPGFCIFLPWEDVISRRDAFLLERAYNKLPKEYKGVRRLLTSPVGGNRNGVIRTADFYLSAVGSRTGELSVDGWLGIPDYALADAVNGEIYFDNYGEFTSIRQKLSDMPEDIRFKRLAGNLLIMAQSGQYNFSRCLSHGEPQAAQLAANEFVSAAIKVCFLLNKKYMPYYKWSFKALKLLDGTENIYSMLSDILFGDNRDASVSDEKIRLIETVSAEITTKLHIMNLTDASCGDLEKHAYSVNDRIRDGNIRNMHILVAV